MEGLFSKERFVYIETFGCQMNENDTTRMVGLLKALNYKTVDEPHRADLILINTCSIREKAEHKVYSSAGRFKRYKRKNPELVIGISGCVAQQEGERLIKRLPYIDLVFGPHNIHRLKTFLADIYLKRQKVVSTDLYDTIDDGEYVATPIEGIKAFVSIMRGCNNFCSYCIVPYTRGREVSRPSKEIIEEIKEYAGKGVKEVTLLGQNVNSYGMSGGDVSFTGLLRMVCGIDGIERVRFVTSHPKDISDSLIYLFGEEDKLCRSIHLPLQSGSNRILERMKRVYSVEDYLSRVSLLRRLYPDMSITTDIIVGFPGETEDDFKETMEVVRTVRFDGIFSFKYSPRPMTLASTFKDQVPEDIKQRRLEELQRLQKDITAEKNRSLVGRTMEVLVEGRSKQDASELTGRTTCNRIVNFPGSPELVGKMVGVFITHGYSNSLRGIYKERSRLCS